MDTRLYLLSEIFRSNFSTSIFDAETLYNAHIVFNSIGNLTKFKDEQPIPSLASSWSQQGNSWIFKFRQGFKCENGEPITTGGFKKSITRHLKWQASKGEVPIFEFLEGFRHFRNGDKEISGIQVTDDTITFKFDRLIEVGVAQYLAMAPFGYIADENFDGLTWRDNTKLISSGPYHLVPIKKDSKVILQRRTDWNEATHGPDEVVITANESDIGDWSSTVVLNRGEKTPYPELKQIFGIPATLFAISLTKDGTGFFSKLENRRAFYKTVHSIQKQENSTAETYIPTDRFYFGQDYSPTETVESWHTEVSPPKSPLKIVAGIGSKYPKQLYIGHILERALSQLKWPYTVDHPARLSREDFYGPNYDMRVSSSEIGAGVEPRLISFLFCSLLGPRYPDPDGKICSLLSDFEKMRITKSEFKDRFYHDLVSQASVIPLFHERYVWNLGNRIDESSFSPFTSIPQYEWVRLKK